MAQRRLRRSGAAALAAVLAALSSPGEVALADVYLVPGDASLRFDLEYLSDTAAIDLPLTTWPLSSADVAGQLANVDIDALERAGRAAAGRLREYLNTADPAAGARFHGYLSGAVSPSVMRGFDAIPRAEAEARAGLSWSGQRVFFNLQATLSANPDDEDDVRPDGSYAGVRLGNWLLSAGWQDRWYGPGQESSLILSTNARPPPGIMLQRGISTPLSSRWLRWTGPWTLTTFMAALGDDRVIDDAWQFGIRGSFRPARGLEIGLSRTAIWCGTNRPCDWSTFGDLLAGNDNRGANVAPEAEPGNQLGGFDLRWALPGGVPAVVYVQWIGEDGRPGAGLVGSWLRQAGLEVWGSIGGIAHRTHIEVSDTSCREGGLGFSDLKPDCAYEHGLYRTGYRFKGRSIGHFADSDSLSVAVRSTLMGDDGDRLSVLLRSVRLNRHGVDNGRHTLAAAAQDVAELTVTYDRPTSLGRIRAAIGYRHADATFGYGLTSDFQLYVAWFSN